MLNLAKCLLGLWLLLIGAAQGKSAYTAEPPLGNFFVRSSEAILESPPETLDRTGDFDPFRWDGTPENRYCHNDPVNHVDVLGLRKKEIVSTDAGNRFRRNANGEWEVRIVTIDTGWWGYKNDYVGEEWQSVSTGQNRLRLKGYDDFTKSGGITTAGSDYIQAASAATGWDENATMQGTLIAGTAMTALVAAPMAAAYGIVAAPAAYVSSSTFAANNIVQIGAVSATAQQVYNRVGPALTRISYHPMLHGIASEGTFTSPLSSVAKTTFPAGYAGGPGAMWRGESGIGLQIALGQDLPGRGLKALANQTGASWWRNWARDGITRRIVDRNFGRAFHQAAGKADTIHFSLDGIDDVAGAVKAGSGGFRPHNMTNAELHYLSTKPELLQKTIFYRNGNIVDSPF